MAARGIDTLLVSEIAEDPRYQVIGSSDINALLGLEKRAGGEPTAAFSLTAFAAILVVCFYASLLLSRFGTTAQLLLTQYGFFLLPTVGCLYAFGFSLRSSLPCQHSHSKSNCADAGAFRLAARRARYG